MGYCTYTPNKRTGGVVVAWIGTGTDAGRQVTINYLARAVLPNPSSDKTLKCADARRQFCLKYTGNINCAVRTVVSRGGGATSNTKATGSSIRIPLIVKAPRNAGGDVSAAINSTIQSVLDTVARITNTGGNTTTYQQGIAADKKENETFVQNNKNKGFQDMCASFPPPFNDCYLTAVAAVGAVGAVIVIGMVLK